MNAQNMQTILDREGVPVEARAELHRCSACSSWASRLHAHDADAENAHIGAMVRWLMEHGGAEMYQHPTDGYVVRVWIGKARREFSASLFEALARACGHIAKEPQ